MNTEFKVQIDKAGRTDSVEETAYLLLQDCHPEDTRNLVVVASCLFVGAVAESHAQVGVDAVVDVNDVTVHLGSSGGVQRGVL